MVEAIADPNGKSLAVCCTDTVAPTTRVPCGSATWMVAIRFLLCSDQKQIKLS
jgi:hypothetical protein